MSSKNKTPRKPENKLVNRGDVIAFSRFLAQDPDFCLRVLRTAQEAILRERAEEERLAAEAAAADAGPPEAPETPDPAVDSESPPVEMAVAE